MSNFKKVQLEFDFTYEDERDFRGELIAELKRHDWYYHFSDDHSVWNSGRNHWEKIREYEKYVGENEFKLLVEKYRPLTKIEIDSLTEYIP